MPARVLDERKRREPAVDLEELRAICGRALELAGLSHNTFGLALIDDARMSDYNRQYRGKEGPTNVLSFPAAPVDGAEAAGLPPAVLADLGDVLISVDTALREAEAEKKPLARRLAELTLHGLLHLAGYDHERSETEALVMWDREQEILTRLFDREPLPRTRPELWVNVTPFAALRRAHGAAEPDPALAAGICELAGARGIAARLGKNLGELQERDLRLLRQTAQTRLDLEMSATKEALAFALDLRPDMVTLVPARRREPTTGGGLDAAGAKKKLAPSVRALAEAGIEVSLFVEPDDRQITAASELGASHVELNAARYAEAKSVAEQERELVHLRRAAELAREQNLRVRAGRGLYCRNVGPVAALPGIEALVIGQALAARSVFTGLDAAVREMSAAIREGAAARQ